MQFDPVQLGFTFAKELATQLITLSTGILTLSVTFTKDILKTIPKGREKLLRIAWGVHLASMIFGVWTLMALTGTLMPKQPRLPGIPFTFEANVRVPAMFQVLLFLLGTLFLVIVYGRGSGALAEDEFRVIVVAPDALAKELGTLKVDRWEFVAFSTQDPANVTVLLKRTRT